MHRRGLFRATSKTVISVCDNPTFSPEVASRSCREASYFTASDRMATTHIIQLPRFALDSYMFAIGTAYSHSVYTHIAPSGVSEMFLPAGPFIPMPAMRYIPVFDVIRGFHSHHLKPFAIGSERVHLLHFLERRVDSVISGARGCVSGVRACGCGGVRVVPCCVHV